MKDRYANNEYLGVSKIQTIIIEEFDWIFREQVNPDVGIDAQFEIVEDGSPLAQFGAIQIKKGDSHFYKSKTEGKLTYYASKEHFEYWTNSSIPVFIFGVLDNDTTIWQYASDSNKYRDREGRFALDIPITNILTLESRARIETIVLDHINLYDIQNTLRNTLTTIAEFNQEMEYSFNNLNESFSLMASHLEAYTNRTIYLKDKGTDTVGSGFSNQNKQKKILIDKYRIQINMLSNRIKAEMKMLETSINEITDLLDRKNELTSEDKIIQTIIYIKPFEILVDKLNEAINSTQMISDSIESHASYDIRFGEAKKNNKKVFNSLKELLINMKLSLENG